ncbi:hypothetical protein SASPL_100546 [Salvia splendens]|uniref:Uncharacterized protein n=1 Tax=Salvia splendens TaxID=180675 RepID=A0A8X9ACK4_SALSN|nr:hypothetical protein SASPL_100546 [Salvia splendens]
MDTSVSSTNAKEAESVPGRITEEQHEEEAPLVFEMTPAVEVPNSQPRFQITALISFKLSEGVQYAAGKENMCWMESVAFTSFGGYFNHPLAIRMLFFQSRSSINKGRDFQDVPKEKPKPVPLIQGPAAGEGLSDRLQCQGTRALNTTQFGSFPSKNCLPIVTLVTVFTIYNSTADSRPTELVTVGNMSYNKVERSMAILNVFLKFVQEAMYGCHVVILTDPTSDLPLPRDRVTIQPIKGEYQVVHLIGDLDDIFSDYHDFDLALTFRNNKDQLLNSGFIAVRGTADGIQKGVAFLQEVLEVYSSKFMRASRMLEDQLALAWVVKSEPNFNMKRFSRREAFQDMIGGASVLFLPCLLYNWTPPEGAGQFHGMHLGVKVVHFKGSRKRLMLEAWNYYLSSRHNLPDMLCIILRSGRAKYDF